MAIVYLELLMLYSPEVQVAALKKFNQILSASIRSQHAMHITGMISQSVGVLITHVNL